MWRCQLYYQREDAIPCCGNKECDALYLKSYYVPNKIYIGDRKTRFVGYYETTHNKNDTAVITGIKGDGTACAILFGFNTTETVYISGTWINKSFTPPSRTDDGYYNLNGKKIGDASKNLNISLGCGNNMIPKGTSTLHIRVKDYEETLYIRRNF